MILIINIGFQQISFDVVNYSASAVLHCVGNMGSDLSSFERGIFIEYSNFLIFEEYCQS